MCEIIPWHSQPRISGSAKFRGQKNCRQHSTDSYFIPFPTSAIHMHEYLKDRPSEVLEHKRAEAAKF
jgi:hypothetical protein